MAFTDYLASTYKSRYYLFKYIKSKLGCPQTQGMTYGEASMSSHDITGGKNIKSRSRSRLCRHPYSCPPMPGPGDRPLRAKHKRPGSL